VTTTTVSNTPLPTKRKPFTYEDYLRLPDGPYREEVLAGELIVSPSPSTVHQRVCFKLGLLLGAHVEQRGLGTMMAAPTDVILSTNTIVVPDLVFVTTAHEDLIRPAGIFGAPDLIIEIISPSAPERDTEVKRRIYAEHGVEHYWIVDPEQRRIWLFRLEKPGEYACVGEYAGEETFAAEPFPNLEIPLEQVWPSE
jgi:Uma2 family endonuclease